MGRDDLEGITVDGVPLSTKIAEDESRAADGEIREAYAEDSSKTTYSRPQPVRHADHAERNGPVETTSQTDLNLMNLKSNIQAAKTLVAAVVAWLLSGREGTSARITADITHFQGSSIQQNAVSAAISNIRKSDLGNLIISTGGASPTYKLEPDALELKPNDAMAIYLKRDKSVSWANVEKVFPFLAETKARLEAQSATIDLSAESDLGREEKKWKLIQDLQGAADLLEEHGSTLLEDDECLEQVQRIFDHISVTLRFGEPDFSDSVNAAIWIGQFSKRLEGIMMQFPDAALIRQELERMMEMFTMNRIIKGFTVEDSRITSEGLRLQRIAEIIFNVDERCMAADGDVTSTLQEMTQEEISEIYGLAKNDPVMARIPEIDKLNDDREIGAGREPGLSLEEIVGKYLPQIAKGINININFGIKGQ